MAKIPLNKFRSIYKRIPVVNLDVSEWYDVDEYETNPNNYTGRDEFVYTPPFNRAGICVLLQVSNSTDSDLKLSCVIQHAKYGDPNKSPSPEPEGPYRPHFVVKKLVVPPNDAISLLTGRLVLFGTDGVKLKPDILFIGAEAEGLTLSAGILESVNTD